jgi:hypothetical protein
MLLPHSTAPLTPLLTLNVFLPAFVVAELPVTNICIRGGVDSVGAGSGSGSSGEGGEEELQWEVLPKALNKGHPAGQVSRAQGCPQC